MKKQALLVVAAGMLLTACNFGGGNNPSGGDTSSAPEEADLATFFENLEEDANFTMVNEGYMTMYGYGYDALYQAYEGEYAEYSSGYLAHPEEGVLEFVFDEDGAVSPTKLVNKSTDLNVYYFVWSPLDLTDFDVETDWVESEEEVGVYSITGADAAGVACGLGGYDSKSASAFSGLDLVVEEGNMAATIVLRAPGTTVDGTEITVTLGNAQNDAIDAWREEPIGLPPADLSDPATAWYAALEEQKNYIMVASNGLTTMLYNDLALWQQNETQSAGIIVTSEGLSYYDYDADTGAVVVESGILNKSAGVTSISEYANTALLFVDFGTLGDWTAVEGQEGTYTAEPGYVSMFLLALTGYSSYANSYYSTITNITMVVDGMNAVISGKFPAAGNALISVDITVGAFNNEALAAHFAA